MQAQVLRLLRTTGAQGEGHHWEGLLSLQQVHEGRNLRRTTALYCPSPLRKGPEREERPQQDLDAIGAVFIFLCDCSFGFLDSGQYCAQASVHTNAGQCCCIFSVPSLETRANEHESLYLTLADLHHSQKVCVCCRQRKTC